MVILETCGYTLFAIHVQAAIHVIKSIWMLLRLVVFGETLVQVDQKDFMLAGLNPSKKYQSTEEVTLSNM